jgi:hypothetical protein
VQFENGKAVPVHTLKYIANVLTKCSTPSFVEMVKYVYMQSKTGAKDLMYSELLRLAEVEYRAA